VEEDHGGVLADSLLEAARTVGRVDDLEALELQVHPAQLPDVILVVDDEDAALRHRPSGALTVPPSAALSSERSPSNCVRRRSLIAPRYSARSVSGVEQAAEQAADDVSGPLQQATDWLRR